MAAPVEPAWTDYETVAASQTAQIMGATGSKGDKLSQVIIIPALAAAGLVTILDGGTSIPIYVGGAVTALPNLQPIVVTLNLTSVNDGGWKITTGASVSVIACGDFT